MLKSFSTPRFGKVAMAAAFAVLLGGQIGVTSSAAQTPPALGAGSYGWTASGPNFISPKTGPKPIQQDARYPYDYHFPGGGEPNTFRIADLDNPILLPWTREELRKNNQRILSGGIGFPNKVACWPRGVPDFLLYSVAPIYFVQTPNRVWILTREDHMVRRVYMNVPHSAHIKPTSYGESVGHYEGDTLIVDTIGVDTRTRVDNFQTPHTDKLHVVERFRLDPAGKTIDVDVTVEDPGAFTTPWHAIQIYSRVEDEIGEVVCAENFRHFGDIGPPPSAGRPDF